MSTIERLKILEEKLQDEKTYKIRNEKAIKYLEKKWKQPEWWDSDFEIVIDILKGGNGNFSRIQEDKMNYKYIVIVKGRDINGKKNSNFTYICGYNHNFIPLWFCVLINKIKGFEVTVTKK